MSKKLRGQKRIWKSIEDWKNRNLYLDLELLKSNQRKYVKISVSPFSDIAIDNREMPVPKGKTKQRILDALLQIHNNWEKQLKDLGEPYYLAFWLYDPNFKNSQVVCAIGQYLDWYNATFYKPEIKKIFNSENYIKVKEELDSFNWIYALEENHFTSEDLEESEEFYYSKTDYIAQQNWYKQQLKRQPRILKDKDVTYYSTKVGIVWIGSKH